MSQNPRKDNPGEALNFHRAFCDLVLESSDADADEIIRSLGKDAATLESQAREAWTSALAENIDNVVYLSRHRTDEIKSEPTAKEKGFCSLMRMLRRRKGMEVVELSLTAQVDPAEVSRIEDEPGYMPTPRTIFQLESFYDLPKDTLARLAGAFVKNRDSIDGELLRFAACSDNIGRLTSEEKKLLNEFVKHLAKRK